MKMYPVAVQNRAKQLVNDIAEILVEEDISESEMTKSFSSRLLPYFLAGKELSLSANEIEDALDEAILASTYNSLVSKGLMDCVENEEGENVYFLTELGKTIGKELWEKS